VTPRRRPRLAPLRGLDGAEIGWLDPSDCEPSSADEVHCGLCGVTYPMRQRLCQRERCPYRQESK
jgi:hypothetical protein